MNRHVKNIVFGAVRGVGSAAYPARRRTLPEPASVRAILIAALHGLGDVLYASSVFPLLKKKYPNAEIDIWVHSRAAEVLKHNPHVRKQYIYDEIVTRRDTEHFRLDWRNRRKFIRELKDVHYDIALDFSWVWGATMMLRSISPRYLAGSSQHGLGFMYDAEYPYQNIFHSPLRDLYANILSGTNIITGDMVQPPAVFYMSDGAKEQAATLLRARGALLEKPAISLHTTAGWKAKEWDIERYAELLKRINVEHNIDIALIGNGARDQKNYDFLRSQNINVINALGSPLDTTAGIISQCSFHLGGDSFPMHLAAALGVPALCIAGPTNPAFFIPRKENSIEVIYHRLYCSSPKNDLYCTRNAGRSCPTIDCLKGIGVEEVLAAEQMLIDTYPSKKA